MENFLKEQGIKVNGIAVSSETPHFLLVNDRDICIQLMSSIVLDFRQVAVHVDDEKRKTIVHRTRAINQSSVSRSKSGFELPYLLTALSCDPDFRASLF